MDYSYPEKLEITPLSRPPIGRNRRFCSPAGSHVRSARHRLAGTDDLGGTKVGLDHAREAAAFPRTLHRVYP